METLNELYRSLAKKYHPDTVSSRDQKLLCEEMMVEINAARANGDLNTLRGIEKLGPVYIAVRNFERIHRAEKQARTGKPQSPQPVYRARPTSTWRICLGSVLRILHPHALWSLFQAWDDHGAAKKLTTIAATAGWIFLFYSCWNLLGEASRLLARHGFTHESVPGLIIVLLRGAFILVSLRCVLSGLIVAVAVGLYLAAAWLCSAILSGILGYFHPLLALVPPWIMMGLLVGLAFALLKKR